MLLMFSLGKEDVFAVDAVGILQAITRLNKLTTYACLDLRSWKSNSPKP